MNQEIVPGKVRVLAIAAACLAGLSGSLLFGPLFFVFSLPLIVGTVVQPWSPGPGRWLMWVGAFFVTVYVGGFVTPEAIDSFRTIRYIHDRNIILLLSLFSLATLAAVACDIVLIAEAWVGRRISRASKPFPRIGDWVVWMSAVSLSAIVFPADIRSVFKYPHITRLEILLTALIFAVVAWFDAALVVDIIRKLRAQWLRKTDERSSHLAS